MKSLPFAGLLLWTLLGVQLAFAQTVYRAESIGYYQGLPSESVFKTAIDPKGFLYVSTQRGISVYDGYRFIASDSVRLAVDAFQYHNGNLYFHDNRHGLATLATIADKPQTIVGNHYNDENPNNDHFENIFVDSGNRIWCTDFNHIKYIQNNSVTQAFATQKNENQIQGSTFFEIKKGTVWAFTKNGAMVWDEKSLKLSKHRNTQLANTSFESAFKLGPHFIIYADVSGQISRLDLRNDSVLKFPKLPESESPAGFARLPGDGLLVYSKHSVFQLHDDQMGYDVLYRSSQSQISHATVDVFSHFIWLSTNKGLVKLAPVESISNYQFPQQVAAGNQTMSIAQDIRDQLWAVDRKANLWRLVENKWLAVPITGVKLQSVHESGQQLFLLSLNKVLVWNGNTFEPLDLGNLPDAPLRKVLLTKENELWILYQGHQPLRFQWPSLKPIPNNFKNRPQLWTENTWNDMYQNSDGKVWIGGWAPKSYGMIFFDPKQNRFVDNSELASNKDKSTYFGDYVNRIAALDHGRMLFSGYGGFNYVEADGRVSKLVDVNTYPIANGRIEGIAQNRSGTISFATADGLHVYIPKSDRVVRISQSDGLPTDELIYAFTQLKNGTLALGTDNGVALIDVDKLLEPKRNDRLSLTAISVNGQIRTVKGNAIELDKDETDLTLFFSDFSYRDRTKVFYRYKFKGDDNWHSLGNNAELTLNHMTPGRYELTIEAGNYMDHWQSKKLMLDITLHPPFYRSALFFIIMAVLAVIGLVLFNKRILDRQRKEAQYMQRIRESEMQTLRAQMNPHFMFNTLNSINSFIIENRSEEASEYLTTFSKLMRSILEYSKQEFIPLRDELLALKLYLELEAVRLENSFDYTFDLQKSVRNDDMIKVPPLILQPFVENAIWHGLNHKPTQGNLYVRITKSGDFLNIVIEDDGIGREAARQLKKQQTNHKSYGIEITQQRILMLDPSNSVTVEDLKTETGEAAGTAVHITLKI